MPNATIHQAQRFTAVLRLEGNGNVPNAAVHSFLFGLESAYLSAFLFTSRELESYYSSPEELPGEFRERIEEVLGSFRVAGRFGGQKASMRRASAIRTLQELIRPEQQLIFAAAQISSPGVWEFLASLNPLEVLRAFLNDRHERRKDIEYREASEKKSLQLEILLKENRVITERIEILRKLGAEDQDLKVIRNQLLGIPFKRLAEAQDKNVIVRALDETVREMVT